MAYGDKYYMAGSANSQKKNIYNGCGSVQQQLGQKLFIVYLCEGVQGINLEWVLDLIVCYFFIFIIWSFFIL